MTTVGDMDGLHVLVADEKSGYQWRTAATLVERVFDTDQWIGTPCVTGSGTRAVVTYAPRGFTNHDTTRDAGGFVAIVDLTSGAVRKLDRRASLAYYNPGCGAGEDVAISAFNEGTKSTTIAVIDAATGKIRSQFTTPGQVTSAVPFAGRVAAASGSRLVSFGSDGTQKTLTSASAVPFRLHPDSSGGLAYQVQAGKRVEVRRLFAGRSTLLGTGNLGAVRVTGSAGRVFVTGPDSAKVKVDKSLKAWTRLAAPVDAEPSTTGALAVLSSSRQQAARPKAMATTATAPVQRPDPLVTIEAKVTATGKQVSFSVRPVAQRPSEGSAMSPALAVTHTATSTGGVRPQSVTAQATTDPSTVPWDPDRACSVPRNDPSIQTLQATAQQVEWAVDLAVSGQLTVTRPANWQDSGMSISWQPQTMFPLHRLTGGGTVPAQVLLGVLAQESNTMQASPHAVDGVTGNVNQGGFYGDDWTTWDTADCGYGIGQVTSGMAIKDGTSMFTADQQKAIATDYASNIAASLNLLIDKWNALENANIIANNGDPQYIENWYFATWAYNSGIQPDARFGNTTGCTPGPNCTDGDGDWGLGWSNNPANPDYPVDRGRFDANDNYDTKHPNLWPYQEKVIGWAYTPLARYDYNADGWRPAYSAGGWNNGPAIPDFSMFCDPNANHCDPKSTTDINGNPGAGQCERWDFHCWWHQSETWAICADPVARPCGNQVLAYSPGNPEPPNASVYPPDCSTAGLPSNAVIVDEVRTLSAAPCTKTWTDQGQFTLSFPASTPSGCSSNCITYQGKIDFHQLGTGFGGHLWFTHMDETPSVTGTWTPPSTTAGWTRIKVHIPESGATTKQADYTINLGDGQSRRRMVNQNWWKNTWVDLGTFNLSAGASVKLSNASWYVADGKADGGDIAFDAVAFIPSTTPIARYVALGDSYSSGESAQPYEEDSDLNGDDECHRSKTQAYSHAVTLPGQSQSIATLQDNNQADFHFLACSGAQSIDLTQASVNTDNTDNTDWRTPYNYHYGEVDQIDASGWLDQDTTLVTISIGGNDVGFGDVATGCLIGVMSCISPGFLLTRSFGDFDGDRGKRVDPEQLTDYEPYLITQLRSHLAVTYEKIHSRAPNARVIVVGYPRLFTPGATDMCTGYSADIQAWMNSMADQLNQTIKNAVGDTHSAYPTMDIRFVDPTSAFTGHAACDYPAWVNKLNLINKASSFHPNASGQAGYATLVNNALAG